MKSLTHYIQEKLVIKKNNRNYSPKTKKELKEIINQRIKEEGNEVDLNDIDVSKITDMSRLFEDLDFNGDISKWNVSNVTNMDSMFYDCKNFNQDISMWNVSKVTNMNSMFLNCKSFNQDISKWNVSNVETMSYMFAGCKTFNQDISNWDVSNVKEHYFTFSICGIQEKYKAKFK